MPCLYQVPVHDLVIDYPGLVHASDVQQPLYGEDVERGDLRD